MVKLKDFALRQITANVAVLSVRRNSHYAVFKVKGVHPLASSHYRKLLYFFAERANATKAYFVYVEERRRGYAEKAAINFTTRFRLTIVKLMDFALRRVIAPKAVLCVRQGAITKYSK